MSLFKWFHMHVISGFGFKMSVSRVRVFVSTEIVDLNVVHQARHVGRAMPLSICFVCGLRKENFQRRPVLSRHFLLGEEIKWATTGILFYHIRAPLLSVLILSNLPNTKFCAKVNKFELNQYTHTACPTKRE